MIAALAAATCTLIAVTPAPGGVRVPAAAWTVGAAILAARRVSPGRIGSGPRVLVVRATGEIAVREAAGGWRRGALRQGSFVAPWLTLVSWRPEGSRWDRTVLLLPGMLGAGEFRRLRVLLRWA